MPEPHRRLSHAGEVAIVLAGLIGAAEDDVVHLVPVHFAVAVRQRLDRDGGEIVGADISERAAITADRRAHGVADEGLGHSGHGQPLTVCFERSREACLERRREPCLDFARH
jgi:hypothetical protein